MDPNANLAEQDAIRSRLANFFEQHRDTDCNSDCDVGCYDEALRDAQRLVHLTDEMNQHLCDGGALPDAWKPKGTVRILSGLRDTHIGYVGAGQEAWTWCGGNMPGGHAKIVAITKVSAGSVQDVTCGSCRSWWESTPEARRP